MILANNIRHYIGGQDFGEPRNWQNLEISINWLKSHEGVNINITDLNFVKKANTYLQKRVMNGMTGGVGIFEGEPYNIEIGEPSNPVYKFEGYLDFTDSNTFIGNQELICSLKKRKGTDWMAEKADSISFAYLYDQGYISNGDFIKVPYVINFVPDGMQMMILSMSTYMMGKELIENIYSLTEAIASATNAATPSVGVSVGVGAGVVTTWDLGDIIWAALKIVARIIYIAALIIAIVKLIEEIFEQLLPKKRHHLGMTWKKMFETFCEYFGLQLQSNLLNSEVGREVHIPEKFAKGGTSGETGFPTNSGPIYTPGDLIRVCKEMWNADFRISNGVFRFERQDFFKEEGTYSLPNVYNNQEKLLDNVKFNTEEMLSNYNIYYQYDVQDQNTLENQTGRVFQAITTPIARMNLDLINIKNLAEISIPFTLGLCKTELTEIEKIAKVLGKFVDDLTGIFGHGTSFANKIEGRIGSLLLSSHFTGYGKIVVMNGSTLAHDQRTPLSAIKLWNDFHYINSFAEVNGLHNQYWRYLGVKVPMTLQEFGLLLENNIGSTEQGERYLIENIVYKPDARTAVIDYRINRKYTNNLRIDYVT